MKSVRKLTLSNGLPVILDLDSGRESVNLSFFLTYPI